MLCGFMAKVFNFEQRIVPAIGIITILQTNDGGAMTCKGCHSDRQGGFNGEIALPRAQGSKQTTLDAPKRYVVERRKARWRHGQTGSRLFLTHRGDPD